MSIKGLLTNYRVLLVEDEYLLALEIADAIERAGGAVAGPFPECARALPYATGGSVDAAVLNVKVRDGNTYPVTILLPDAGIPFVFATGQSIATEPPEWSAATWISKPYEPEELVRVLAGMLKEGTGQTSES